MLLQLLTGLAGASLGVILLRFQIRTSERILERAAADPVEPENIDEANGLLARARGAQVRISMQTLEKTGRRFVLASRQNPSAWNVALGFLAYRSSINPKAPAGPAHKGEPLVQTAYDYHRVRGTEAPRFSVTGVVATPSAAQLDYIGEDLNRNQAKGFAYIFAEGGSMAIDGMHLRHVILLGVHVEYFGGPLQLEDVYFLNCDFKMDLGRNTQDLALAMLEPSPATTFSAA
jgi:hypothetical protein